MLQHGGRVRHVERDYGTGGLSKEGEKVTQTNPLDKDHLRDEMHSAWENAPPTTINSGKPVTLFRKLNPP